MGWMDQVEQTDDMVLLFHAGKCMKNEKQLISSRERWSVSCEVKKYEEWNKNDRIDGNFIDFFQKEAKQKMSEKAH